MGKMQRLVSAVDLATGRCARYVEAVCVVLRSRPYAMLQDEANGSDACLVSDFGEHCLHAVHKNKARKSDVKILKSMPKRYINSFQCTPVRGVTLVQLFFALFNAHLELKFGVFQYLL